MLELKHSDAWRSIWQDGRVDIKGDAEIAKVAYGAYYYIISSIKKSRSTDNISDIKANYHVVRVEQTSQTRQTNRGD
jgi:trehalose/maltose hydrolase-like predicted phosphorylase